MSRSSFVLSCAAALALQLVASPAWAGKPAERVAANSPKRYQVTIVLLHHGEKFTHKTYVERSAFDDLEGGDKREADPYVTEARRKLAEKNGFSRETYGDRLEGMVRPTLLEISVKDCHRNQSTSIYKRQSS